MVDNRHGPPLRYHRLWFKEHVHELLCIRISLCVRFVTVCSGQGITNRFLLRGDSKVIKLEADCLFIILILVLYSSITYLISGLWPKINRTFKRHCVIVFCNRPNSKHEYMTSISDLKNHMITLLNSINVKILLDLGMTYTTRFKSQDLLVPFLCWTPLYLFGHVIVTQSRFLIWIRLDTTFTRFQKWWS